MSNVLIKYNDPDWTGISVIGKLPPVSVAPSTTNQLVEFTGTNTASRFVGNSDATKIFGITLGWIRSTAVTATIDGNAMTVVAAPIVTSGSTTIGTAIAYRSFSSGPNATIAITFSSSLAIANAAFWIVTNGSSVQDTITVSSSAIATISSSLDLIKEGGALGVAVAETSSNPMIWTTLVEVNDRAAAGTLFRFSDAGLSGTSITATATATVSADTGVVDYKSLTAVSFSVPG